MDSGKVKSMSLQCQACASYLLNIQARPQGSAPELPTLQELQERFDQYRELASTQADESSKKIKSLERQLDVRVPMFLRDFVSLPLGLTYPVTTTTTIIHNTTHAHTYTHILNVRTEF